MADESVMIEVLKVRPNWLSMLTYSGPDYIDDLTVILQVSKVA
jgi:hypothetical protein